VPIQGYGSVDIRIQDQSQQENRILRLQDVALCQGMACNLVSLRQLRKRGIWWDNRPGFNCLRKANNSMLCDLTDHYDQFVIEYIPANRTIASFVSAKFNSWTQRKPMIGDALLWHQRLGHPGPGALEHIVNCSQGVRLRGPTTVECDACAVSKIKRQIRREPREPARGPGERLAVDFHDYQKGIGNYTSLMLITDRYSGLIWDYYLQDRTANSIIACFNSLFQILEKRYSIQPKVIECDNEITEVKPRVRIFLESKALKMEPSAPNTQSQDGGAERSGGVIKMKSQAMRAGAKFPAFLWPEIVRASVYLYNRLPKYQHKWISPYERFSKLAEIRRYQRKIGSLLYVAVMTRPDIAFATSRLARFLVNPSRTHQDAADRTLLYLNRTKALALQLGGGDDLVVSSDASFADNSLDRKSSQAYAMKLFGGLIGWRANKQDTVTTSTTEAELLALSQTAKESQFVSRLIQELSVRLDDQRIRIQCDNQQTIRLVTAETALLQTKLRHVDIHNHWLRQEVSEKRIIVDYTPSKDTLADGLTKALQNNAFRACVQQLGLVDISERLESQQLQELIPEDYLKNSDSE
jgi:hypothetical protein